MIIKKFEKQVERFGQRIAVKTRDKNFTYDELNRYSNQVAHQLIKGDDELEKASNKQRVSLLFSHGADMIAALLGALKAGKTYIPLDVTHPEKRLSYILENSQSYLILSDNRNLALVERLAERCPRDLEILNIDGINPESPDTNINYSDKEIPGETPAYILYTSGSTGNPKGVIQSHRNILHHIEAWTRRFVITSADRMTLLASFSHDGSVPDIYSSLLNGATLYPIDIKQTDIQELARQLVKEKITVWHSVPTFYRYFTTQINGNEGFPHLRLVIVGGEAVRNDDLTLFKRNFPYSKFANIYGQTESTVNSIWLVSQGEDSSQIEIGEPVADTQMMLVNDDGDIIGDMGVGEIVIASDYVGLGYWKETDLTRKVFTHDDELGRLYWTGDLGRYTADGRIVILGRKDWQVKIRGYRVELGEIESVLLQHEAVRETAALLKTNETADPYICAYVVPVPGKKDIDTQLREYLSQQLPDYMIPRYFIMMDRLPTTPNGKIDRNNLPGPLQELCSGVEYEAPGSEIEKRLVEIWQEVLEVEEIGINYNFIELGGQSLLLLSIISEIKAAFQVELQFQEVFNHPTIKELAKIIAGKEKKVLPAIGPADKKVWYAAAPDQVRLFALSQYEEIDTTYNMPIIRVIKGKIDLGRFEGVFHRLIGRHEVFRTSFDVVDEKVIQQIHPEEEIDFNMEYLEYEAGPGQENELESLIDTFLRPFDLKNPPLIRVQLVKLAQDRHLFILDKHHIISDGISEVILIREFERLYHGSKLPELHLQYKDYAEWYNRLNQSGGLEEQEKFWLSILHGELPVLHLPLDYPRPPIQRFEGQVIHFWLGRASTSGVKQLTKQTGTTLYIVLLAVFNILLHKYTQQEDMIVGTIISGRTHPELENMMGLFVKTLALRNFPSPGKPFADFLAEVRENTVNAFENQMYPFDRLVEKFNMEKGQGRNPLFDVAFILQNYDKSVEYNDNDDESLRLAAYDYDKKSSKFDLSLEALEINDDIKCSLKYCTALFRGSAIDLMRDRLLVLFENILNQPHAKIRDLEMLTPEERQRLIDEFNRTEADYPRDKTIHQLFVEQVERTPDQIALIGQMANRKLPIPNNAESFGQTLNACGENVSITYRKLNEKSNQLAFLLNKKGVQSDTIVGIMVERSIGMIIGILGILKSGGAYLPIDPYYPRERIQYMLKESNAQVLVVDDTSCASWLSFAPKALLNLSEGHYHNFPASQLPSFPASPSSSMAYIIYTSGSTGRPKGIPIGHRNVVNFIKGITLRISFESGKSILVLTTISFDIFVLETLLPLSGGLKVIIANKQQQLDLGLLEKLVKCNQIEMVQVTPSRLRLMLEGIDWLRGVETLMVGGEAFPKELRERLQENFGGKMFNLYGPTETTVWSTLKDLTGNRGGAITIGRPISNTYIYILARDRQLQPIGVPGELCIGGDGLARGYLNQPELTAEKFRRAVIHHSSLVIGSSSKINHRSFKLFPNDQCPMTNDRLYKTEDLARWLSDGEIEFLGRIDHQVKIRGIRIESQEIENFLLNHQAIQEAVVTVWVNDRGEKYLCAYIVSHSQLAANDLKAFLSRDLPDYMIPSYFVHLEEIPLTPNGKIDRKVLPAPEIIPVESYVAPRDEIEEKLVALWVEVLGKDLVQESQIKIGIDDNFFALGGHSLNAALLVSKIHKAFNVNLLLEDIFKHPTVRGTVGLIRKAVQKKYTSIKAVEKKDYYELSSAQKRLFIIQQIDDRGIGYNMPASFILEGELDLTRLEDVFGKVTRRHESFRTSFQIIEGEAVQRIQQDIELNIEYYNIKEVEVEINVVEERFSDMEGTRGLAPLSIEPATSLISSFIRPFDLSAAPLLRVGLIKIGDRKHLMMVDMHHIISDGTSFRQLEIEFMSLYAGNRLPPLKIHYKDYAKWQSSEHNSKTLSYLEKFWDQQFKDEIPILNLPADFPRPTVQSFEGDCVGFQLCSQETLSLKKLALEQDVTIYMVLLAVCNICLSKLSGQKDIIIGTPTAGRMHVELQNIIGMFVNTLALRNYPIPGKTFKDFLLEIKQRTLEAFGNQDYPFEDLVERVVTTRDTSRNPLFDVLFVFQNMDMPGIYIPGLTLKPYQYENKTSKFDLTLRAAEREGNLLMGFEYRTGLFKESTINRFSQFLKKIIVSVIAQPGRKIREIEIISDAEKEQVLYYFNDTKREYPGEETIHELFQQQVERTPDRIALVGKFQNTKYKHSGALRPDLNAFVNGHLSYIELNESSDQLAGLLIGKGVKPDTIVAIMVKRSLEMIIGILGILKAGGAYLPIDPEYPEKRIKYMLTNCGAKILLTTHTLATEAKMLRSEVGTKNFEILFLDTPSSPSLQTSDFSNFLTSDFPSYPFNLAYVIYTSGTTGRPKGVMVEHRNVCNLVLGLKERIYEKYQGIMNVCFVSPDVFDASVKQIFGALLLGHSLYVVPEEIRFSGEDLLRYYERYQVDISDGTPAHLRLILESAADDIRITCNVKRFIIGGEALTKDIVARFFNKCNPTNSETKSIITNIYGPTECCVDSTCFDISSTDNAGLSAYDTIPIGKPLPNQQVYIVDHGLKLQPPGIVGELLIGGSNVSRGYLGQKESTSEKFIPSPFHQGKRLYKTGDLAKWLPDGNVQFLDRIDQQVKIRGFRIELAEIENRLLNHAAIKEAVVLIKKDESGNSYLSAYFVSNREFPSSELREYLLEYLPEYMIPAYFTRLGKIPLTPIGKIDRKALPVSEIKAGDNFEAPRDRIEKKLVDIWSEALGIETEKMGINDNFFHLGGHSLKAIALVSRINKKLEVKLPITELFTNPTIAGISKYIKGVKRNKYSGLTRVEKKEYYDLSFAQRRLFILDKAEGSINTAYNLPGAMLIEGQLDIERIEHSFTTLVKRHDSIRTSFDIKGGKPVQIIHDTMVFKIKYSMLEEQPEGDTLDLGKPKELSQVIKDFIKPFELDKAPLLRVTLIRLGSQKHLLMFDMHHIVSDGISRRILIREFLQLYEGKNPPEFQFQYKDFIEWQNSQLYAEEMKKQENYWLNRFSGAIPFLNIPTDYPRPPVKDFKGNTINWEIDRILLGKIKEVMAETGTTLYMVLLAVFNILLSRYTGQEDIIAGVPTAARNHPDLENIVGMFVNTLAMRNYPRRELSFGDFLQEVKEHALKAFENQDYPLEELVNKLGIPKDYSRNPLFDALFVSENLEIPKLEMKGLALSPVEIENRISHMDLVFYIIEGIDKILLRLEYATALFKQSSMEGLLKHYVEILEQAVNDINIQLKEIDISQDLLVAQTNMIDENLEDFGF